MAVNIQLRDYQLRDINVGDWFFLPFVLAQPTPVVQPLVRHPKSTAGVADERRTAGQESGFVHVMGTMPTGAENPPRNDFLNDLGIEEQRSKIGIGLNQLAPPAITRGLLTGLQCKLGGVKIAPGTEERLSEQTGRAPTQQRAFPFHSFPAARTSQAQDRPIPGADLLPA